MKEEGAPAAGREDCPCKRRRCSRHGDCAACRAHHSTIKNSPVACERPSREEARAQRRAQKEASK